MFKPGIFETLYNISPDLTSKYANVTALKGLYSYDPSYLLIPNTMRWYYGAINCNFSISITDGYGLYITHMMIMTGDGNIPISWSLEGVSHGKTIEIDSHFEDKSINKSYTKYLFPIKQGYYTDFLSKLTGPNYEYILYILLKLC